MHLRILFVILSLWVLPCQALAAQAVETVGQTGYIDWKNQRAIASGTGAPPAQAANAAQARAAARRAALLDARRNLLEVIGQVRIDSSTRVANLLVQDDVITTRISGVLKFSQILSETRLSDGSYSVTVAIPLTGELSRELFKAAPPQSRMPSQQQSKLEQRVAQLERQVQTLIKALQAQSSRNRQSQGGKQFDTRYSLLTERISALEERLACGPVPSSAPAIAPTAPIDRKTAAKVRQATGLIVDARGTDFQPSLKPRLLSPSGETLYPGSGADYERGVTHGFVRYFKDISKAAASTRAGAYPMTIRGKARGGDLVVSDEDASLLKAALSQGADFLNQLNVTIVF